MELTVEQRAELRAVVNSPDVSAAVATRARLVGAVLAEQSDEWTEGRRYMGLELLAKSRIRIVTAEPDPAVGESSTTAEALTA